MVKRRSTCDARRPLLDAARARCPHFYIAELSRVYFPKEAIALQLTHLHALRVEAPAALFVHCARNTTKWLSSVTRWNIGLRRLHLLKLVRRIAGQRGGSGARRRGGGACEMQGGYNQQGYGYGQQGYGQQQGYQQARR